MNETGRKVERLARTAVRKAMAGERRDFTITKFGRHEDGYLHARVTPLHGKPIYVHRKFGSWMAPGTVKNHAVERDVLYEIAHELQVKARQYERAERHTPDQSECGTLLQESDQQED